MNFIFLVGFSNLTEDTSTNSVEFNVKEQSLKTSSFWDLTGTFMMTDVYHNGDIEPGLYKTIAGILIDETLENFTWSKTAATYPWCNGSGTKEDPYIIELVYIDGNFTGSIYPVYSNILIRHSRSFFTIKNCSLHKNGINEGGGIYLYNTTNGAILSNYLTYNRYGIYLFESHNNTICFNNLLSNHDQELVGTGSAIILDGYGNGKGSCNNTIEDNIMVNHCIEIIIFYSVNNIVNRNFIKNTLFGYFPGTGGAGLYLRDSNYTSITYNIFAGDYADYSNPDGDYIITEQNCIGNVISNNFEQNLSSSSVKLLIAEEPKTWFSLVESNYNYIFGNRLLKTNPITNPTIPGYTIYIILIIELISIIIFSTILRKKHLI